MPTRGENVPSPSIKNCQNENKSLHLTTLRMPKSKNRIMWHGSEITCPNGLLWMADTAGRTSERARETDERERESRGGGG